MPIVVKIPKKVENILGEEGSSELIDFINTAFNDHKIDIIREVELRFESKLEALKSELRKEIVESSAKLRNEVTESIGALRNEMAESKVEIIKWMFIFWIGTTFTLLGGVAALIKILI
ncbi:MAG: hypothetical protein SCARUB_00561 [Candidatus Scalindua rubra]|uniref:DUF1640 domain-containing protein n=1 Tax=Candidatus Scalindua rubra TaxID=1872076 RepID=A0A1E3XF91_9BACT|nr:MAG: hypothetical protein SCARUB_00561 [Candidatus Scalindua rubra]